MPTASGYITYVNQIGFIDPVYFANGENVTGQPDGSVASADFSSGGSSATILATHAIQIPEGNTITGITIKPTWRDSQSSGGSCDLFVVMKRAEGGSALVHNDNVQAPQGTLSESQYSGDISSLTNEIVNDGNIEIAVLNSDAGQVIEIDSFEVSIQYTSPRNVAPYCNRKFVKSPLIALS